MQDKEDGGNRRQSAGDFLGLKTPSKAKGANLHDSVAEEADEEPSQHLNIKKLRKQETQR